MKAYNETELQREIYEAINEQNHFWWGCVIGLQYGRLSVKRVNEDEELSYGVKTEEEKSRTFQPIVKVKYGSPYKGGEIKGHLVSWFDNENHNPVNVSYLILKPEPVIFETGATLHFINSLILFTDNTSNLIKLRDAIYLENVNETKLNPEVFIPLCDSARRLYLRELDYNCGEYRSVNKMQYKKYYNHVNEFCQLFANRFNGWKSDHGFVTILN